MMIKDFVAMKMMIKTIMRIPLGMKAILTITKALTKIVITMMKMEDVETLPIISITILTMTMKMISIIKFLEK